MLKDRNFAIGLVFIFAIGIVLLATMALLPPMLQNILGYPVITSGLVLAPRGVGTMISMIMVGRLVQKVDARILILGGLLLTAYSLWEMTAFSPEMGAGLIVINGVVQGLGLGLLFVPLSTLAFATLRPELRTEASSLFSLMRNLGSSIGVSIMATLLAQNTQVNHAELAAHVSPFNPALDNFAMPPGMSVAEGGTAALAYLNKLATTQAQMISYLDDFKMMAIVTLACIPMLLLLRGKAQCGARRRASGGLANRRLGEREIGKAPFGEPSDASLSALLMWPHAFRPSAAPPGSEPERLSAEVPGPARPRIGQAIERFGRRSWSIGSPGTTCASLQHAA